MAPKKKAAAKPAANEPAAPKKAAVKKSAPKKPAAKAAQKKAAAKKPAAQPAASAKPAVRKSRRLQQQEPLEVAEGAAVGADGDQDADEQDDDAQVEPQRPTKKAAARKPRAKKAAAAAAAPEPEVEDEDEDEDDVPVVPTKRKGEGRKAASPQPASAADGDEVEDDGAPVRPTAKARGKQAVRPGADASDGDEDDSPELPVETGEAEPADKGKRKAGATKGGPSKKAKPDDNFIAFEDDSDGDEEAAGDQHVGSFKDRQTSEAHENTVGRKREQARNKALEATPVEFNNSRWQLGVQLGSGTFGAAYVCYRTDPVSGRVTERLAIKDMYHDRRQYVDWTHWDGGPRDFDNREHMEIRAMQALTKVGASKCVRYLGHHNDHARYSTRVFMDYCPHGSLHDLIVREQKAGRRGTEVRKVRNERLILEPALWKFFEDLTEACLYMAYGSLEETATASKADYSAPYDLNGSWRKIVHRDFKPHNVFLGPAHESEWPSYPTACLGDYGQAIFTHPADDHNPLEYAMYVGTKGYRPFELRAFSSKQSLDFVPGPKLGDATNVWGAGCTVLRLM